MKCHQLIKEVFIHSLLSLKDAGGGNIPRTEMSKTVLRFFCFLICLHFTKVKLQAAGRCRLARK